MKSVIEHPSLGKITLCCSRRSTRIKIAVRPSGEVRLSYPPYISLQRAMAFLESKAEWVKSSLKKYSEHAISPTLTKEQIEQLRTEAKATIPARVADIAAMHSFKYGRVTIRATRSKWGSCTAQGDISLSLFLMTLPEHLRDYVILHELCHTVHHNHSPQFHSLVNSLCGGMERELAAQLRQYAIR